MQWTISLDAIISVAGYVVTFWCFLARMDRRLAVVEYKQDALSTQLKDYQEIQTRLARCEESTRSAHHRLNNLEAGYHAYEQGDMENHRR